MTVHPTAAVGVPTSELSGDKLRSYVRRWLDENLPAHFRVDRLSDRAPTLEESKAFEAAMYEAGLTGVTWPTQFGGRGRTLREHLIVSQEIGRTPMPESVNSIGKELVGPIVLGIGTPEQKAALLPAILEMREVWCQGFSEPGAGSDLAGLRTRAWREGNGWRVDGQKIWTSGAARSQRCLLLARTGVPEDRHRGLCLFAVPLDRAGIEVRTIRSMDGKDNFCEVFFDNVELTEDEALGAPDEGWSAALRVLAIERATNRMHRAWRFENELTHLVDAAMTDPGLRAALADGAVARQIGTTRVAIEVLKAHVEGAVSAITEGETVGARGSLSKLHWSEAHQRFAADAIALLSRAVLPHGVAVRAALERFRSIYLQARAETIYAGTTEIQLGIIADRVLRLPKG
ncbi:acyl-CoA dehydrogenase [Acuticoccus sediminis]|uniref:Acyl-CoA dehydrogenase n=1 Tax=Acuticoccus sediminis TaxID=2184697 RepID=A0A8B2NVX4_9HYPH|nr:acyl-CoA dehydrogenase family protein [Acuticoccus sediminis]RAI02468.1 acyl-CoA dehydrogenase [Acuticoccus sediminis]